VATKNKYGYTVENFITIKIQHNKKSHNDRECLYQIVQKRGSQLHTKTFNRKKLISKCLK